ncbi:PQQ-dependent sugar dehydrogenase [Lysobacter sp. FW306-1B-D06B]|uniref:PQQ-dependent sugar dehydrogenase n=1 Tax=Lysobacter sp. FW306-1B-D06B TaxID=3140250 RepID=UPI003140088A
MTPRFRPVFATFAALVLCAAGTPGVAAPRVAYAAPTGTCDGYPRLDIGMAKGFCAGLVIGPTAADRTRPMRLPRSLLQLDDGSWLVTDLGSWDGANGAIFRLRTAPGGVPALTRVLDGLHMPHAIARGPDGKVYVGEMSRIFRFDPDAVDARASIEPVVTGLPDNRLHDNRHPLSKFVFAPDGALLVNVGAPSDQCLRADGTPPGRTCPETDGDEHAASIRRYALQSPGQWSRDYTVHARGLRNSVALAVHASGTVLQGENSYDFTTRWFPFDEINVITGGRHYGWPYCADVAAPTPGWKAARAMDCTSNAHTPPALLLPPHSAPLDMLWYDGAMFPALRGRLLMTWHGYRSVGGRIVSYATDARGVPAPDRNARYPLYGASSRAYGAAPAANAVVMTPGWNLAAGRRPQGSPVGLAVAKDGAIWTADDRAGLVIRIAVDRP